MNEIFISVVIPAYCEAKRIGKALDSIQAYFAHKEYIPEVIVVDDGSKDRTSAVVAEYQKHIPYLKLITFPKNKGKGAAVKAGMLQARGQYKLFMDADNSVDISHLDFFLEQMNKGGHDIAIGSVELKNSNAVEHNGKYRRILSRLSKIPIRMLATPGILDTQRGFKLFTKKAASIIFPLQTIERFGFDIELIVIALKHNLLIKELPVIWDNPEGSTVTLSSYSKTLRELFRIVWNKYTGVYKESKHLTLFNEEEEEMKGKGFRYKGKEFVHHTNLHHTETAFYTLVPVQKVLFVAIVLFIAAAFYFDWKLTLISILSTLTILYFLDLVFNGFVIYRSFSMSPEITLSKKELESLSNDELPLYTIFCPLYKEWRVVPQFAEAMSNLDYPTDKLQIIFLLEENDKETIQKIQEANLPSYFETVIVPHSFPKTKPKAMNYGLPYVRGKYLVIYDAEDIPESDQLKKSVLAFRKVADNVVCIQAKLNFYNVGQNILTRLFTAEYSLWFDLVLPGLQSINAPLPLGGTSNHFQVTSLRELAGWDAFNVTEDCDLGMRLAKHGYQTAIVESTTYEEANSRLKNWYNQRSRWIKGYIQTYLVHTRNPSIFFKNGNYKDFFIFQITVGGKIISMFINPLMWIVTLCYFLFRAKVGLFIESLFPGPILYIGVFSFVAGNFLYLYYYMIGCAKRGYDGLIKYIFLVPFYWLAMSLAAWKGVYEVIVKPHYWAKTVHGLHLAGSKDATDKGNVEEPAPVVIHTAVEQKKETIKRPQVIKPTLVYKIKQFAFTGAGLLVVSSVATNGINFGFNAYLSRKLTLEDFGILAVFSTIVYFLTIFISAFSTTVTHHVAYAQGKQDTASSISFFKRLRKIAFLITFALSIVWFGLSTFIAQFLNISDIFLIAFFAPTIIFGIMEGINNGFQQGNLSFHTIAYIILIEALAKFGAAIILIHYNYHAFVALALPVSLFVSFLTSTWFAHRIVKRLSRTTIEDTEPQASFPHRFYFASIFTNLSTMAFLSLDVLLVKHYLDPVSAGQYGLLSLVGKMIFFFGSLLNVFVIALVSRDEGRGENPSQAFYKIFFCTLALIICSGIGLSLFGPVIIPFLLGPKALSIIGYLPLYAVAISLFTATTTIVTYHLARKHYEFSWASCIVAFLLAIGIILNHESLSQVVQTVFRVNIVYVSVIFFLHLFYGSFYIIFYNIIDVLKVFSPIIPEQEIAANGKRILILNWRDMKHVYAGGAELYSEQLARHWVKAGHAVTLFCGNDGLNYGDEIVEGVRIIRRGGFYLVYVCAFLYYIFRFRNKFDIVVDCENGIPFFAPLYVKQPVYCLIHHVHQDVFRKYLNPLLAVVASFLEKVLMPFVYKNVRFITVSESSKKDIVSTLGVSPKSIDIIYPGVDLEFLYPGKKSPTPLITYIGRLKAYKSIHVLINSFNMIVQELPEARLVIAGDGEEKVILERLVKNLGHEKEIIFTGKVSEQEKRILLQESWVVVNPSHMEGWGITTIEANACGTPAIASDVAGLRDSVRHGETGFLFEYGNEVALAQTMYDVLTSPFIRNRAEEAALSWAQNFSWSSTSGKFMDVISTAKTFSHVSPHLTLKKPSLFNIIIGAIILIFTNRMGKEIATLPQSLGPYTLLRGIKKQDPLKNMVMGIYRNGDKKYFVKRWEGKVRDLNYYFLVNEYLTNALLAKKTTEVDGKNFAFAHVATYFISPTSLTVMFEYIEGQVLSDMPIDVQAVITAQALRGLGTISGTLSYQEQKSLGRRSSAYYIFLLPALYLLLLAYSPRNYKIWCKSLYACMSCYFSLVSKPVVLAHRDLTPDNIMISGKTIYILDCESVALTLAGYDYAYLLVTPGHKELTDRLPHRFKNKNTEFLKNYIALHHVLGSGEYFNFDKKYLHILKEIHA